MVEHQKFPIVRRLEPQVLRPIYGPIQSVGKEIFPDTYKLNFLKNLRVHPIFHVSLLKSVTCDTSRPN